MNRSFHNRFFSAQDHAQFAHLAAVSITRPLLILRLTLINLLISIDPISFLLFLVFNLNVYYLLLLSIALRNFIIKLLSGNPTVDR